MARQIHQSECVHCEDSDQPEHSPSLIRVFACAQWVHLAKDPSLLPADSEYSEQMLSKLNGCLSLSDVHRYWFSHFAFPFYKLNRVPQIV